MSQVMKIAWLIFILVKNGNNSNIEKNTK